MLRVRIAGRRHRLLDAAVVVVDDCAVVLIEIHEVRSSTARNAADRTISRPAPFRFAGDSPRARVTTTSPGACMLSSSSFSLLLFSVDPATIPDAVRAGVSGIVVDWEGAGKRERQSGADTERSPPARRLRRVRRATDGLVICRLQRAQPELAGRGRTGGRRGRDEVLIPIVRRVDEVERILELVNGRCGVGILMRRATPYAWPASCARFPSSRVYVGLNDPRSIAARRTFSRPWWMARSPMCAAPASVPFGFAGLTRPDAGRPIPCRLLIAEMAASTRSSRSCGVTTATCAAATRRSRSLGCVPPLRRPGRAAPKKRRGISRRWRPASRPGPRRWPRGTPA